MKSLHTRLDPIKPEVLKYTETFGRFPAMTEFKVADYPGFCKWLKEGTENENFGLRPKISLNNHRTMGDQLVEAFLRKVTTLDAQTAELRSEVKYLKYQLSLTQGKDQQQALAVLEACQA